MGLSVMIEEEIADIVTGVLESLEEEEEVDNSQPKFKVSQVKDDVNFVTGYVQESQKGKHIALL